MKASNPQQLMILEPPELMKGKVTPVSGSRSVAPKMFSVSCTTSRPAAQQAEME